ncbi:Variable small protein 2 (plasmid) [Borrelia crocidurae str. Achema]|uniref:Variable small protein 2 n=1 Tax=Borrelia crocidurae (strain Achema) TaxID=1155096 RepID=I0FET4_BORCA|nr:Variable small protein 2 [Borrelia crocidurae str. Achema]
MGKVKEVETLLKSVDEFAKAIGKKLTKTTGAIASDASSNNGPLVVGAYSVVSDVNAKLAVLEKSSEVFDVLKVKVVDAKAKGQAFLDKLKGDDDLCKKEVDDANVKKAIDRSDGSKDKGAKELDDLNTAIDGLLKDANAVVESAIGELGLFVKVDPKRS